MKIIDLATVVNDHCSSSSAQCHIVKSVQIIIDTLRIFGAEHTAISFNGGKDACIVLYLLIAALHTGKSSGTLDMLGNEVKVVYFVDQFEFPQMTKFLELTKATFGIHYINLELSFKEGMASLVDMGAQAILMGTRVGDPYSAGLEHFSPSTSGWPAFMRVNPIIHWKYDQVWSFIRQFDLPYCSLYDDGYTSIGNTKNSVKNPALAQPDGKFLPAYMLADVERERDSRC